MSSNCNGYTEKEPTRVDDDNFSSPDFINGKNSDHWFRGFEKVPHVKVSRIDVRPYLTKMKLKRQSKLTSLKKCTVNIPRLDLYKLNSTLCTPPTKSKAQLPSNRCITNIKCKICGKYYFSDKKLQNHIHNKHLIVYETSISKTKKRVSFSDHVVIHEPPVLFHRCRKCIKTFDNYNSLKQHMKSMHKKRKCYICDYCMKKFTDRMFFKVHIKLHCDICGEFFPNKTKYTEHKMYTCKVIKLHKCYMCNETFYTNIALTEHNYEHAGTFFVCDVCKEHCDDKCTLAHHISFLHRNDRPAELYEMRLLGHDRLYLCKYCDTTSLVRDMIEKHIETLPDLSNRILNGHKDCFACSQCWKTFELEKDLLQHKWTHFLSVKNEETINSCDNIDSNENNSQCHIDVNGNNNTGEKTSVNNVSDCLIPKVLVQRLSNVKEYFDKLYGNNSTSIAPPSKNDLPVANGKKDSMKKDFPVVNGEKDSMKKDFPVVNGEKDSIKKKQKKKITYSKYQCNNCLKYYSSKYCLNRHIQTVHIDFENLKCRECEETFVWPSLLLSHNCLRRPRPEMTFQDTRPDILFTNYQQLEDSPNGYDDEIMDIEIPPPIVELTEYEDGDAVNDDGCCNANNTTLHTVDTLHNKGYKLVLQEVPVEF